LSTTVEILLQIASKRASGCCSYLDGTLTLAGTNGGGVVRLIPLAERGSIDLDDGVLDQGTGTDQLVVGGVVDNSNDTGLAGDGLGTPGEVTGIQTHGTELAVASTGADLVDALSTELGVGSLTTQLELSLLAILGALGSGSGALVAGVSADT
jgi:hypothetical protein